MNLPEELKYASTHEWVKLEGEIATVGITDHAQEMLGELVYVELPEIGREVEAGEPAAVVESVKAASDVYAPISGEIIEANDSVDATPETINESAFEDGWLFKMKVANPTEIDALMSATDYAADNEAD